jgi:hypothetical protein
MMEFWGKGVASGEEDKGKVAPLDNGAAQLSTDISVKSVLSVVKGLEIR